MNSDSFKQGEGSKRAEHQMPERVTEETPDRNRGVPGSEV